MPESVLLSRELKGGTAEERQKTRAVDAAHARVRELWQDPEWKAKATERLNAARRLPRTEASRKRMSEAAKKRWATADRSHLGAHLKGPAHAAAQTARNLRRWHPEWDEQTLRAKTDEHIKAKPPKLAVPRGCKICGKPLNKGRRKFCDFVCRSRASLLKRNVAGDVQQMFLGVLAARGHTVTEACRVMGLPRGRIDSWLGTGGRLKLDAVPAMATYIGVDPDQLIAMQGGTDEDRRSRGDGADGEAYADRVRNDPELRKKHADWGRMARPAVGVKKEDGDRKRGTTIEGYWQGGRYDHLRGRKTSTHERAGHVRGALAWRHPEWDAARVEAETIRHLLRGVPGKALKGCAPAGNLKAKDEREAWEWLQPPLRAGQTRGQQIVEAFLAEHPEPSAEERWQFATEMAPRFGQPAQHLVNLIEIGLRERGKIKSHGPERNARRHEIILSVLESRQLGPWDRWPWSFSDKVAAAVCEVEGDGQTDGITIGRYWRWHRPTCSTCAPLRPGIRQS